MIGRHTLREIREELKRHLAPPGKDPIRWLEDRIQESQAHPERGGDEVMQSLLNFLKAPRRKRPTPPGPVKRSGRSRAG
jgi:hypothetical protein